MQKNSNKHVITGRTRIFGIIADPILQVKTPEEMNALMAACGEDRVLIPMHVTEAQLENAVGGFRSIQNLDGFIVTVPHKTAIVALCDSLSPAAQMVGAVNVVRRDADGHLHGDILDGVGFVAGLRSSGIEPRGMSVYLCGAGGAAQAISFALGEAGVSHITIANRTHAKAEELINRLAAEFSQLSLAIGSPDPSGHELVVNATSMGLRDSDDYPCDVSLLGADQVVAEIIMQPERTRLLEAASAKGCRIHLGRPMLRCQIKLMAEAMGVESQRPLQTGGGE